MREEKYSEFIRSSLYMRKGFEFYFQNQPSTLNSIMTAITKDPDLSDFKKATFHALVREIRFQGVKMGVKS